MGGGNRGGQRLPFPWRMSLQLRLALVTSLIMLLALSGLGFFSGLVLQNALLANMDQQLHVQSLALLNDLEHGSLTHLHDDVLMFKDTESVAQVFANGLLLKTLGNAPLEPLVNEAFVQGVRDDRRTVGDWRVYTQTKGMWAVRVARPITQMNRILQMYIVWTAAAVLFVTLLGGGFTAWVVRYNLQPLQDIAERTKTVGIDRPMPHLDLKNEIGDMARALERGRQAFYDMRRREGRFLADAAHELRTPVAAMLSEVEHHLERPRFDDRSMLRVARSRLKHLRDLTANLLALTRAERTISRTNVNLLELASDVTDRLMVLAAEKDLGLSCDGTAVMVQGDPVLLARVLENLIGNAIKFCDAGDIRVLIRKEAQSAVLEVRDEGPGFPDYLRVLEPFKRVGHREGSGLGLAVVQAITEAHNGQLQLRTDERGGVAQVVLPASSAFQV